MNRKAALLAVAALAGCTAPAVRPEAGLSRQWMVGGWVLEGDDCDSDAGVVYHPDGRWSSYGVSGTWRLDGTRMITAVTRSDDDDPDSKAPEQKFVETIEFRGTKAFSARRDDGTVRQFTRCGD